MDLKTYLATSSGSGIALAEKLGVAPAYLSQMVNGHRSVSPERCVEIERITEGAVTRRDLRPDDWRAIWPELADKDVYATAFKAGLVTDRRKAQQPYTGADRRKGV